MALAWNLRQPALASVIGASRPEQVVNNVAALEKLKFSESELATIEQILTEQPAIDWNAGRS